MTQQQWTGQLELTVFNNGRKSVARDIFFDKALKVMRPIYLNQSDIPTFYIVNVGGGYLDGDRYKMDFTVKDEAAVTLTSQGATKIYKTLNDRVEQYQTFTIGNKGYLEYVADPVIAYANAKFYQHNIFNLDMHGSLFYSDILTPGYAQDESLFSYKYMHLLNEIYVDNQLVAYDNLLLSPEQNNVSDIGYMEGYTHIGSCYFIHPEVTQKYIDSIYDEIKHVAQQYDCRFGITKLATHGLTIRILSLKTQVIEKILAHVQDFIVRTTYNRETHFLRKY